MLIQIPDGHQKEMKTSGSKHKDLSEKEVRHSSFYNPLYSDEFSHAYKCNKDGIIHYIS